MNIQSAEKGWWIKWSVLLLLAVVLSILAARMAYFPGDVTLARFVQAVLPSDPAWAQAITNTVSAPWQYVLLGLTVVIAWLLAGWRAALLAVASYLILTLPGPWLQQFIGRPRPTPDLVRVVAKSAHPSFPSTFALTYVSLLGYLAALTYRRAGAANRAVFFISLLTLIVGGAARVALGAHWPSDVLGAYLIGFVVTTLLVRLARVPRNPVSF